MSFQSEENNEYKGRNDNIKIKSRRYDIKKIRKY